MLLTLGAVFTTHGFLFMDETYQFLDFSSHGLNPQEPFLTYQLISVALHGSSFHPAVVYVPDLVEHIILLPKKKIPLDIGWRSLHARPEDLLSLRGGFFSHVVFSPVPCIKQLLYFRYNG